MCTGDARGERHAGGGVPERVQRTGRDAGRLAVLGEPVREPVRVDHPAELVGEHEIPVLVGVPGEGPSQALGCPGARAAPAWCRGRAPPCAVTWPTWAARQAGDEPAVDVGLGRQGCEEDRVSRVFDLSGLRPEVDPTRSFGSMPSLSRKPRGYRLEARPQCRSDARACVR